MKEKSEMLASQVKPQPTIDLVTAPKQEQSVLTQCPPFAPPRPPGPCLPGIVPGPTPCIPKCPPACLPSSMPRGCVPDYLKPPPPKPPKPN